MAFDVDVSEALSMASRLDRAAGQVGAAVVDTVTEVARLTEAAAKAYAPVDSGALRGSITTSVAGSGGAAGASALITANIRYSAYVEYGTSFTPAQPFMTPAAGVAERSLPPEAEQRVGRAIEQALG